ncbi:MAG: sigma-70 family RNA polymerase sigma factor [Myxococcales bacterium]|nr:sigma-70 family RNA polymerase sigma factor [Myxococcales bacterium]MCB9717384.1 sigma-70 family RNA polymerase sigma factor [Myxococcales bacterium]
MLDESLLREFLTARGDDAGAPVPGLGKALEGVLYRARVQEASFELPAAGFLRYLGERCSGIEDLIEHLKAMHAGDLWLACGCAMGQRRALVRFQARFGPDIDMAIARSNNANISAEDFRQHLMSKLFVAADGLPPRITEYNGLGSLRGWIRITIVRQVIDFVRHNRRRDLGHQVDETEMLGLRAVEADPELAYVRNTYQAELREALKEGFATLTPRERNLLRLHLIHRMSIDDVARIYDVHRATAHRWRLRAQENLLEASRAALRSRLGTDTRGLRDALGAVESDLHITVQRYLSRDTEDEHGGKVDEGSG